MISQQFISDHPEIDWNVYKKQQSVPHSESEQSQSYQEPEQPYSDMPLGQEQENARDKEGTKILPHLVSGMLQGAQGLLSMLPDTSEQIDPLLEKYGLKDRIPNLHGIDVNKTMGLASPRPGSLNDWSEFAGKFLLPVPAFARGTGAAAQIGKTAINAAKPVANIASGGISKGIQYLKPGNEAEAFRASLGSGTSKENIEELSKRAQFASQSRQTEALIPKNKLYEQEGKSDVYKTPESQLPEGNPEKFAGMFSEGEPVSEGKIIALQKALKDYRSGKKDINLGGDPQDRFMETAENIFNIPEMSEKDLGKVEDVLSIPTKRDSSYFSDPDVTTPYSTKGNVIQLHNKYYKNPNFNNYQALRSAITTQIRKLGVAVKNGVDTAIEKHEQLQSNLNNLDKDANNFIETLPENIQNLDKDFRQKYQTYAKTYRKGDKETGASLTLRRLAEGKHDLVTDSQVQKLFSHPTEADKQAILDMGPIAGRNAIYSALQRVPENDAEGMAKTILDLKRTKGFDKYITPEIEKWAINMLKHVRNVKYIKDAMGSVAGGAAFGLPGMIGGAALVHGFPHIKNIAIKGHKYIKGK